MSQTAEEKAAAKAAKETEKAAAKAAKEAAGDKDSVTVKYRDHRGEPTERVFSRDLHGDEFADLAEEFRKTNATRIIA